MVTGFSSLIIEIGDTKNSLPQWGVVGSVLVHRAENNVEISQFLLKQGKGPVISIHEHFPKTMQALLAS